MKAENIAHWAWGRLIRAMFSSRLEKSNRWSKFLYVLKPLVQQTVFSEFYCLLNDSLFNLSLFGKEWRPQKKYWMKKNEICGQNRTHSAYRRSALIRRTVFTWYFQVDKQQYPSSSYLASSCQASRCPSSHPLSIAAIDTCYRPDKINLHIEFHAFRRSDLRESRDSRFKTLHSMWTLWTLAIVAGRTGGLCGSINVRFYQFWSGRNGQCLKNNPNIACALFVGEMARRDCTASFHAPSLLVYHSKYSVISGESPVSMHGIEWPLMLSHWHRFTGSVNETFQFLV